MTTSGTKEWADSNINIYSGCSHDCKYCYAKKMAYRYHRIADMSEWKTMVLNLTALSKNVPNKEGRIMFPSTHDITPETLDPCMQKIDQILAAGNSVLITTKPHLDCIKAICDRFTERREQIQFRITMGHYDPEALKFWEPGAPSPKERNAALRYAFDAGYKTSISMEPLLTTAPLKLIIPINEYVTESIWIGVMNHVSKHDFADSEEKYYLKIQQTRSPKFLTDLKKELLDYEKLHRQNKIRYKDSIRNILKTNLQSNILDFTESTNMEDPSK